MQTEEKDRDQDQGEAEKEGQSRVKKVEMIVIFIDHQVPNNITGVEIDHLGMGQGLCQETGRRKGSKSQGQGQGTIMVEGIVNVVTNRVGGKEIWMEE